jgi:hypothetical protein
MNALALIYRHDGHHLRQIWRTGDIAIFERALSPEHPAHELEWVVVREVPDKTMPDGAISSAHEACPSPARWGAAGWSFPIRERDFVLQLAAHLVRIEKGRPSFIRASITKWKLTGSLRK